MSEKLQDAIKAIKAGDDVSGELLLAQVLKADPRHESALMWLFKISESPQRRREIVAWCLTVNPDNRWAKRATAIIKMEEDGIEARLRAEQVKLSRAEALIEAEVSQFQSQEWAALAQSGPGDIIDESQSPLWRRRLLIGAALIGLGISIALVIMALT